MWRNWKLCALLVGIYNDIDYEKQYGNAQNLKIELSYDLEILSIDAKDLKSRLQRDFCIPLFTAALVGIA